MGATLSSRPPEAGTLPQMSHDLPLAVTAAWWFHAWLHARVSVDEVVMALQQHTPVHSLSGATSTRTPEAADGLVDALATLQLAGATGVACALPAPGDPAGLRGPMDLTRDAVEAGGVLLALGSDLALLPEAVGSATLWQLRHAHPRPPGDLGDADRTLRSTLLEALDRLQDLDVASWSPDATDEVLNLHHTPALHAPPGVPATAVRLAERAVRLLAVAEVAMADGASGAVTSSEVIRRQDALLDLERAARRALQAAASPDAWPEP